MWKWNQEAENVLSGAGCVRDRGQTETRLPAHSCYMGCNYLVLGVAVTGGMGTCLLTLRGTTHDIKSGNGNGQSVLGGAVTGVGHGPLGQLRLDYAPGS